MSGHNKWSKIKNKKAVTDAAKSKIFGKMVRLISVESKKCAGDTNSPSLRAAIDKAKAANVPNDNIERAVKKGAGGEGGNLDSVTYECYGPGGCAVVIEALTDNKNRTSQEIKHLLSKNGYELAAPGSALWAFEKKDGDWLAKTLTPIPETDEEKLSLLIEQLEEHDDVQDVYTNTE